MAEKCGSTHSAGLALKPQLRARILHHKPEAEKPAPSDILPPARPYLLNLPKVPSAQRPEPMGDILLPPALGFLTFATPSGCLWLPRRRGSRENR